LDAHSQALITRTNAKSHPEGGHLQYYRNTWLRERTARDVARIYERCIKEGNLD